MTGLGSSSAINGEAWSARTPFSCSDLSNLPRFKTEADFAVLSRVCLLRGEMTILGNLLALHNLSLDLALGLSHR